MSATIASERRSRAVDVRNHHAAEVASVPLLPRDAAAPREGHVDKNFLRFLLAAALLMRSLPAAMPDAICPSCGMLITAEPHRDSDQCIQALEQEIRRLQELLALVKRSDIAARGCKRSTST
jgi:hypothetical protein